VVNLIENETSMETKIKIMIVIYDILVVGAASSRDHAMMAIERLFFAAGSRSHEKSRYFGLVSYEVSDFEAAVAETRTLTPETSNYFNVVVSLMIGPKVKAAFRS
jgi:hypothetical protein